MAEIVKRGDEYFIEYYAQGLKFAKHGGKNLSFAHKIKSEIEASVPANIEDIYKVRDDDIDHFFAALESMRPALIPPRALNII